MGINKIAVVGATGNVGREMLSILSERKFPCEEVIALASEKSEGDSISFGNKELVVQSLASYDFSDTSIALFSAGGSISEVYAPIAAEQGCIVIDNSSKFRMDNDVPLIVPEVNIEMLDHYKTTNIIANPNCSTIQMVVALKPLEDLSSINRINVSTYQSTSGAGKVAMEELFNQTKGIFSNQEVEPESFTKQIAFNVIPQIGLFLENGNTEEEQKMINETKKIIRPDILVNATCVRVPTFIGHAESINVEFDSPISEEEAREVLEHASGCSVYDERENGGYSTPVDSAGNDATYISRIRRDETVEYGLNLWVVSDNLRKGAALNAIQIAEALNEDFLY
jgi:aspartate-semialdehyde dehydrogenase|tara:strand:+ start:309 stop:1325 length:1017 start_codon:yes stop_codon:yes gene_type:complete